MFSFAAKQALTGTQLNAVLVQWDAATSVFRDGNGVEVRPRKEYIGASISTAVATNVAHTANVTVPLEVADIDTHGFSDGTGFTIPAEFEGKTVRVFVSMLLASNATGYRYIRMYRNGAVVALGAKHSAYVAALPFEVEWVGQVAAGDTFYMTSQHNAGVTLAVNVSTYYTRMTIEVLD